MIQYDQRFWGPVPTLSLLREKQAAVIFFCSLCTEQEERYGFYQSIPPSQFSPRWLDSAGPIRNPRLARNIPVPWAVPDKLDMQTNSFPPPNPGRRWKLGSLPDYMVKHSAQGLWWEVVLNLPTEFCKSVNVHPGCRRLSTNFQISHAENLSMNCCICGRKEDPRLPTLPPC